MTDEEKARIAKAKYAHCLSRERLAFVNSLPHEEQVYIWASLFDEVPDNVRMALLERNQAIIKAVVPEAPEEERAALPFKESEQALRPSSFFGTRRPLIQVYE